MIKSFGMSLIVLLGMALVSGRAVAWDHGHDRDGDDRKEARDHDGDRHHGRRDRDDDGGEPRGWSHGRKEGWKNSNCDLPPGLAKKNPDCGESRHDHDRDWDRDGDRDRDRDRVVVSRTPTHAPARSRTTVPAPVRRPVTTTHKVTTKKVNTLEPKNAADAVRAKAQATSH